MLCIPVEIYVPLPVPCILNRTSLDRSVAGWKIKMKFVLAQPDSWRSEPLGGSEKSNS